MKYISQHMKLPGHPRLFSSRTYELSALARTSKNTPSVQTNDLTFRLKVISSNVYFFISVHYLVHAVGGMAVPRWLRPLFKHQIFFRLHR